MTWHLLQILRRLPLVPDDDLEILACLNCILLHTLASSDIEGSVSQQTLTKGAFGDVYI